MDKNPYIAIGTRGTSLTRLAILPTSLRDGENPLPKPFNKRNPLYIKSHAWVANSKETDTFKLFRIADAIARAEVVAINDIGWTMELGDTHRGEAFFPKGWKVGDQQPPCVAVRSPTWIGSTLELRNRGNLPNVRGTFNFSTLISAQRHTGPVKASSSSRRWSKDDLLVALNVYHKLTFGQFDQRNALVRQVAERMDRTPSSLAMKLSNFASLDPALQLRGIKGLAGASALDRLMWDDFHTDLNQTVPASEGAMRALFNADESSEIEMLPKEGVRVRKRLPQGPTETIANVKLRRGQEYFRDAVLNNCGGRCALTGLAVRDLLIASHILPWTTHPEERLNVRNGLSLSRLHDAAFDRLLISFDDDYRMLISPRLKAELSERTMSQNFGAYVGESLHFPEDAALPERSFLATHRAWFLKKR